MTVAELCEKSEFKIVAGIVETENEIKGCYIGDLLSLAMAKVQEGFVWITIQTNINVVAVASLQDAACVIIADGLVPDENTVAKAEEERIPILTSEMSAYEIAKYLGESGI